MRTQRNAIVLGEHLAAWRKLLGLTAQQLSERAGISRNTLRRLEQGDVGVGMESFLNVLGALGRLDAFVAALDPYETELGRARADQALPRRVRQ